MKKLLILVTIYLFGMVIADVSFIANQYQPNEHEYDTTTTTTPPPPPHPYEFSYEAGRYPGHVDRTHSEISDGSGVVRGAFSYVDPRQEVRTVEYVADSQGFHPVLSHEQKDTAAVARAKERHFALYNQIAERNSHPQTAETAEATQPRDTAAVAHAKNKHFTLFDKIAMEHAHIAAEREAERRAYEATSSPNEVFEPRYYEEEE